MNMRRTAMIDERTFEFIDAIIRKDSKQAERIALDFEQGEQISLFEYGGENDSCTYE